MAPKFLQDSRFWDNTEHGCRAQAGDWGKTPTPGAVGAGGSWQHQNQAAKGSVPAVPCPETEQVRTCCRGCVRMGPQP